eukprot:3931847-Rhodomonas_salina.3
MPREAPHSQGTNCHQQSHLAAAVAMAGGAGTRHLLVPEGQHFLDFARASNFHGLQAQQPKQVRGQLRVESALPARGPNRRHTTPQTQQSIFAFLVPRTRASNPRPPTEHTSQALAGGSRPPSPV